MFGLQVDEFAVLVGGTILALRALGGVIKILWWYAVDSRRIVSLRMWVSVLTGLALVLIAVGLTSMVIGGVPRILRTPICLVVAFLSFIAGCLFDITFGVWIHHLSNRLMALRIPQYRERLHHGDDSVKLEAARRLSSLGWRALPARPELLAALHDSSAEVRAAAAEAILVAIPDPPDDDPDVLKGARLLLADSGLPVRVYAAAILVACRAPSPESLPTLSDGLKCEDLNVRGLAVRALGQLGPAAAPAIPALRELALAPDSATDGAVETLAKIGEAAIPALIVVLERGDSFAKGSAVRALGNMGEPARAALPALRRLSIQRTLLTAETKKAIRKLGGDREESRE